MFKALGNPQRFHIVETLAECQPCLTYEIVETTPLAQATVSQHLKVLQEAGLVRGEADGTATCYWLDVDGIRWMKDQIGDWLAVCCQTA
jgi:DNA-binding transcriptional ArsR family regulator